MQSVDGASWSSPAAYLYTLQLDAFSLAWEYLRRSPDYKQEFHRFLTGGEGVRPEHWALRDWEDPKRDARELEPSWLPYQTALRVVRMPESASLPRFGFWTMPGTKALWHDVKHVGLTARVAGKVYRVNLSSDLG